MNELGLVSGFLLGLMGSGHCLGMCGGIISTLSAATDNQKSHWPKTIAYQLGRLISYGLAGIIFGFLGFQLGKLFGFPLLPVLSALLMISMGLYLSRLWMALTYLEKIGGLIWRRISPLSKSLLPVKSTQHALLLGSLWGWLPCGLVYTALGYALAASNPLYSGLYMIAFGLGTLPMTLFAGAASAEFKQLINLKAVRLTSGITLVGFGFYLMWTILSPETQSHAHHH